MIHPLTLSLVNLGDGGTTGGPSGVNEVRGVVVKNADPEADMDLGAPKDRRREYIRDERALCWGGAD
jgi:hypothetical protein